jgi:hypothetical protein
MLLWNNANDFFGINLFFFFKCHKLLTKSERRQILKHMSQKEKRHGLFQHFIKKMIFLFILSAFCSPLSSIIEDGSTIVCQNGTGPCTQNKIRMNALENKCMTAMYQYNSGIRRWYSKTSIIYQYDPFWQQNYITVDCLKIPQGPDVLPYRPNSISNSNAVEKSDVSVNKPSTPIIPISNKHLIRKPILAFVRPYYPISTQKHKHV